MQINGIGCSLVDNLYSPVDFKSKEYRKWSAETGVKNGLITGGLIFGEDLEASSGVPYKTFLTEVTGGNIIPQQNVGGPSIVAIIHMTQILEPEQFSFGFFGCMGNDQPGRFITEKLKQFNIDTTGYQISGGPTPFTDVLSDPSFHDNNGERTFINYIGAAGEITGDDLPKDFFNADMLIFGGTALTPRIHDDLSMLLKKAKGKDLITCVNTVYDFRNQKRAPDKRWPLVSNDEDFRLIDVLISDNEEALRISGCKDKKDAAEFFLSMGVHSGIITHGAEKLVCFSNGTLFEESGIFMMPVSEEAGRKMKQASAEEADTTGCGDNFAGGVYASIAEQLSGSKANLSTRPSLQKAAALGAISGGFAGLYKGGVYYEQRAGEKLKLLKSLLEGYNVQTGGRYE